MSKEIASRIIEIRKSNSLTQTEFAERLNTTRPKIAAYELNKVNFDSSFLDYICKVFGVNENWMRTGFGEMYVDDDAVTVAQVVEKYRLDRLDCKIIEAYLNLTETQRNVFKEYARSLVDAVLSDDNYEDYRETYIKENAAPMAARHGDVDGLQEVANLYDNADREKQDK